MSESNLSISRRNIWNSFSKMACMIVIVIQLENCCMNTRGRQRSVNSQNNPPDLTHFRFYIWGPLRVCCTVKHLQKWTVTACSKNTTHHIKFMLFPWTGKNICTFVSSRTMDIMSIFCNSWHTMIDMPMVSDLGVHSVHFYSSEWKSGYSNCGRKRRCQHWKVHVSTQNRSRTGDMWFYRSRFSLWLSFTIKTLCITDWKEDPQN